MSFGLSLNLTSTGFGVAVGTLVIVGVAVTVGVGVMVGVGVVVAVAAEASWLLNAAWAAAAAAASEAMMLSGDVPGLPAGDAAARGDDAGGTVVAELCADACVEED